MEITKEMLDELERVASLGTKEPWASSRVEQPNGALQKILIGNPRTAGPYYGPVCTVPVIRSVSPRRGELITAEMPVFAEYDAELIITARNALPLLIAEVRRLGALLKT